MGGLANSVGSVGTGSAGAPSELGAAGLTAPQANTLGVQVLGPGETPSGSPPSGILGQLSALGNGLTGGAVGSQQNNVAQILGNIFGEQSGLNQIGGVKQLLAGSPVTGPAIKPGAQADVQHNHGHFLSAGGILRGYLGSGGST